MGHFPVILRNIATKFVVNTCRCKYKMYKYRITFWRQLWSYNCCQNAIQYSSICCTGIIHVFLMTGNFVLIITSLTFQGTPRKSQVTSLPSDYSDVQPDNYDPDFITQISSKMQVPYTIGAQEGDHHHQAPAENVQYRQHMMVPEKILVAGIPTMYPGKLPANSKIVDI